MVAADGRHLRLTDFAGTATLALHGLVVSAGNGLGGRVVTTARPARVEDYAADPRISHEYDAPVTAEGLRAIAAVPVAMGGSVLAVLYARHPRAARGGQPRAGRHGPGRACGPGRRSPYAGRSHAGWPSSNIAAARSAPAATASEWEEVRLAHADLRTLAAETTDPR